MGIYRPPDTRVGCDLPDHRITDFGHDGLHFLYSRDVSGSLSLGHGEISLSGKWHKATLMSKHA